MKLGHLWKKAEQFEILKKNICEQIKSSDINKREIICRSRISETHFYRMLKNESFNANQLSRIFAAILAMEKLNH